VRAAATGLHEVVAHALGKTAVLVPVVLSFSVASAQSYVMVSGQVSLYQNDRPVAPVGAVKVCEMVLSPFVAVVPPSRAQKAPPWQPAPMTDSEAPVGVHPASVPVSKPPFVIPDPGGVGDDEVTVIDSDTVWAPESAVPWTVAVAVPGVADAAAEKESVELAPAVTDEGLKDAVTPAGRPDAERLIDCALPLTSALLTVTDEAPPWTTDTEGELRESEKSLTGAAVTVSDSAAACEPEVAVPVTVRV
jgi:hypothetical protein